VRCEEKVVVVVVVVVVVGGGISEGKSVRVLERRVRQRRQPKAKSTRVLGAWQFIYFYFPETNLHILCKQFSATTEFLDEP